MERERRCIQNVPFVEDLNSYRGAYKVNGRILHLIMGQHFILQVCILKRFFTCGAFCNSSSVSTENMHQYVTVEKHVVVFFSLASAGHTTILR